MQRHFTAPKKECIKKNVQREIISLLSLLLSHSCSVTSPLPLSLCVLVFCSCLGLKCVLICALPFVGFLFTGNKGQLKIKIKRSIYPSLSLSISRSPSLSP